MLCNFSMRARVFTLAASGFLPQKILGGSAPESYSHWPDTFCSGHSGGERTESRWQEGVSPAEQLGDGSGRIMWTLPWGLPSRSQCRGGCPNVHTRMHRPHVSTGVWGAAGALIQFQVMAFKRRSRETLEEQADSQHQVWKPFSSLGVCGWSVSESLVIWCFCPLRPQLRFYSKPEKD